MPGGLLSPWVPAPRTRRVEVWGRTLEVPLVGLLKAFVVLLVTGQLARIPVASAGAKEAPLLVNDVALMILLLSGLLAAVRRRSLVVDRVAGLGLLFALVGATSAVLAIPRFGLSAFEVTFSLAYLARWIAYFGVYLVVVNFVRKSEVESVYGVLEATILAFAAFGVFQSAFLPGFAQIVYPEAELYTQWDPQGHRLVSTFLDPNLAGGLLVIGFVVMAARASVGVAISPWKALLMAVAAVLTLSRSTALALFAGGVVVLVGRGLSKRALRMAAGGGVVLLLGSPWLIPMATKFNKLDLSDPSLLSRLIAWARALMIFSDHPIIGVGFNTYGFVQFRYGFEGLSQRTFGLDGGLLFIAVMTGVLGLVVYAWLVGLFLTRCRRIWTRPDAAPESRGLALGAAAATVALVVHSLFVNSLLYPFLMEVMWILWGLVMVAGRRGPEA